MVAWAVYRMLASGFFATEIPMLTVQDGRLLCQRQSGNGFGTVLLSQN